MDGRIVGYDVIVPGYGVFSGGIEREGERGERYIRWYCMGGICDLPSQTLIRELLYFWQEVSDRHLRIRSRLVALHDPSNQAVM